MSVLRIKQMCARLFQLETDLQVLFFANDSDDGQPTLEHTLVGGKASEQAASEHAAKVKAAIARG